MYSRQSMFLIPLELILKYSNDSSKRSWKKQI